MKRSGIRTPGSVLFRKFWCWLFTHAELGDAGTVTSAAKGARPMPLKQCLGCGEFLIQRTARNAHVKAVK